MKAVNRTTFVKRNNSDKIKGQRNKSKENLLNAKGYFFSGCCFDGEFVKVLRSEPSTQTSNDSPIAISAFGNSNSYP